MASQAKLFVLTGPSGAGLSSIVAGLFSSRNDITSVVPVTARKMKDGEQDGVGFFFYDLDGWNALKESGDLLETTEFAGNDYGTSRRLVNEQLAAGKNVVLNLEVSRAAQIKKSMPEAVCVYVAPSSVEKLRGIYEKTARSRFEITARMEMAEKEQEASGFCDATVFSDSESAAVKELSDLIARETV